MDEPRIFLCHASEDKSRVQELYHRLEEAGYQPWLDKEDLLPGQNWRHEIEKIVRDPYNIVVVCLSRNSVTKRGVVQQEIKWAMDVLDQTPEGTIYLIPARLEECQVPDRLSTLQWVSLFEPGGFEKLKRALDFELGKRYQPLEPEMVLIPAGEFLMGSNPKEDKDAKKNEQPQHLVYLPDYYIAKTPVTELQYRAFVAVTEYNMPMHWKSNELSTSKGKRPVAYLTWRKALAYCEWLAQVTGKTYRLPSEAEWEKAARGTDGRIYPWGNDWDVGRCNSKESDKGYPTPVEDYPQGASPYGLLDMVGNVWEWTFSRLRPYPYQSDDGREDLNPEGLRVVRGGSWLHSRDFARCAFRLGRGQGFRDVYFGLRLCVSSLSSAS